MYNSKKITINKLENSKDFMAGMTQKRAQKALFSLWCHMKRKTIRMIKTLKR